MIVRAMSGPSQSVPPLIHESSLRQRNKESLREAKVEPIAMVMIMIMRRLEWFEHLKRRDEKDKRAVVEMMMEGKRSRGRPKLWWKDTVRRGMKALKIRKEWSTDREK